jgi:hypothetical protein
VTIATQLEAWLVLWLGAGLNDTVLGSITRADIAVSLLYLLAAAVISVLAAANLRHRSSPGAPSEAPNALNRHVLAALRKPLHVLIWIFGLYIAATPLLARLRPEQDVSAFENAMDLIFKLGAATANSRSTARQVDCDHTRQARRLVGTSVGDGSAGDAAGHRHHAGGAVDWTTGDGSRRCGQIDEHRANFGGRRAAISLRKHFSTPCSQPIRYQHRR